MSPHPPPRAAAPIALPEAAARRVLLLHAIETAATDDALWTAEDGRWATQLTRETAPPGAEASAGAAAWLDQRARHALQRMAPRDPALPRLLDARAWRTAWVLLAAVLGLVAGVAVDAIGNGQVINLLAPPVWGVVLWNLVVYALLLVPSPPALQRWLATRMAVWGPRSARSVGAASGVARHPGLAAFQLQWLRQSTPLMVARAALLLHVAAAALALGLIGGLYLRGLVLDYRAGWQSTFLDAAQVRAALALLLAPASAATGIAVPDAATLQAMRIGPGIAPTATAAPWLHLIAATLGLFVVLPRLVLAGLAASRARRLSLHLPLTLDAVYVQRLLRAQQGSSAMVRVVPHGQAPSPAALRQLQRLLAAELGDALSLQVLAPVGYGDEDQLPDPVSGPAREAESLQAAALQLVWVDLATTPEDEVHGRLLQMLRSAAPAVPLLVVADERGFRSRFAANPARIAERQAGWQRWAQTQGVGFFGIDSTAQASEAGSGASTATLGGRAGGAPVHAPASAPANDDSAGRALRAALQA